jgi:hypothetical protein
MRALAPEALILLALVPSELSMTSAEVWFRSTRPVNEDLSVI